MAKQSQLGTANSALAITMALGIPVGLSTDKFRTVNQAISFTQVASGGLEVYPVSDTIGFSSAVNLTYSLTVNQIIDFTQVGGRARDASVSQSISFDGTVGEFNYVADRNPVEQVIGFSQIAFVSQALSSAQNLGLNQSVSVSAPYKASVYHFLGIHQHTTTPFRVWIEDTIGITDMVRIPIPLIITDTVNFVQVTTGPAGRDMSHTMNLVQTVDVGYWYSASNTMEMDHSNTVISNFIRSLTQNAGIEQSLTYFEDTPCAKKQYTPFQGEGATPPDNLSVSSGSILDRFSLYQPTLGPRSLEVILRAPEMDDRDRNAYSRVKGETRGGKIRVYADPIWPKVRTLAVTITGITETEVDELQTFLDTTLGQEIGFTDWKGNLWSGTITNPDEVASQDGRGKWTVSLEIEAEPLENLIPENNDGDGQGITFSQSVGVVKI